MKVDVSPFDRNIFIYNRYYFVFWKSHSLVTVSTMFLDSILGFSDLGCAIHIYLCELLNTLCDNVIHQGYFRVHKRFSVCLFSIQLFPALYVCALIRSIYRGVANI